MNGPASLVTTAAVGVPPLSFSVTDDLLAEIVDLSEGSVQLASLTTMNLAPCSKPILRTNGSLLPV